MIVIKRHIVGCDESTSKATLTFAVDQQTVYETQGQELSAEMCIAGFSKAFEKLIHTNDGGEHSISLHKKCACGSNILLAVCQQSADDWETIYQGYLHGWKIAADGSPEPTREDFIRVIALKWHYKIEANDRLAWLQTQLAKLFGHNPTVRSSDLRWGS